MKKKIIFISDAGEKIGFGHLNRINNLANFFFLKGYECYLFGIKKKYILNNFYKKIFCKNILNNNKINLKFLKKNVRSDNFFLIIDTFKINTKIQKILFKSKIKWLQFDNLNKKNKKIYADIIVNTNPQVNKKNYSKRLFDGRKQLLLLGTKYLIMRDEFKIKYQHQKQSIFICSGGGTKDNGLVVFVTTLLLKKFNNLRLIIILKKKDPREKKIINLKNGTNRLLIIRDTNRISKYFSQSKIAIISGGTILLESLFFKIHRIVLSTAKNQKKNSQAWNNLSYASYLGNIKQIKKRLKFKLQKKIIYFLKTNKTKRLKESAINGKEKIIKEVLKKL